MIEARIIELGREPTIEGSRITVFDILHYREAGWYRDEIAVLFRLSSQQVEVALRYIEEHKEKVMAENAEIEARIAGAIPPSSKPKSTLPGPCSTMIDELRRSRGQEVQGEGHSGGH